MTFFVALIVLALATTAFNAAPAAAQKTPRARKSLNKTQSSPNDGAKSHFIGLRDFSGFALEENTTKKDEAGTQPDERAWVSPPLEAPLAWNDLVVSWNVQLPPGGYLKIEARAVYPDRATKYYTLGLWSPDAARHPRHSVNGQKDADGDVQTDTLVLKRPGARVQLRLTLGGLAADASGTNSLAALKALKFLGLSFLDARAEAEAKAKGDADAKAPAREPNRAAWGTTIAVPQRYQRDYEGGGVWCSPTSTSMILAHWAATLKRPELDKGVLEVVQGVHDPNWPGTGNWPFNTAYAGALPGLRAYVTRFDDLRELEDWIAAGVPVALSVSYDLLKGKPEDAGGGHLVVCVGFTAAGDVVFNDPAWRVPPGERKVFPRADVIAGWGHSHNTVYLIYPEDAAVPADFLGHWERFENRK